MERRHLNKTFLGEYQPVTRREYLAKCEVYHLHNWLSKLVVTYKIHNQFQASHTVQRRLSKCIIQKAPNPCLARANQQKCQETQYILNYKLLKLCIEIYRFRSNTLPGGFYCPIFRNQLSCFVAVPYTGHRNFLN